MKKQKKCYIYTRVSTAVQMDGYSLDAQIDKLQGFLSVPISYYFTEPEKLSKKDPEMYEFIVRYLK